MSEPDDLELDGVDGGGRAHLHLERRTSNRPVAVLAVVVAVLGAGLTFLLVTLASRGQVSAHNRELVDELACQVQQLGGDPVGGVSCPPTPQPTPAPSSRAPSSGPTVVVVVPSFAPGPGGGVPRVYVTVPGGSSSSSSSSRHTADPDPNPPPSPRRTSSPSARPSPSASRCPLPIPLLCPAPASDPRSP